MSNSIEVLLEQHRIAQASMKDAKKLESDLRDEICEHYVKQGYNTVGTHNIPEGPYDIKTARKLNISLDKELLAKIMSDLSVDEKACVELEPKLVESAYKLIVELGANSDPSYNATSVLDQAVTIKDAKPSLDVTLREE